jgi:AcrR family transcriptional regulator
MDEELPRVLRLLWGHESTRRRGPRPAMSLRQIGAAGVRVADAEGVGAVSMSRIARELGYTTMSLYRYVDSKDDLLTVMLDEAYGEPAPTVAMSGDWRARIQDWCLALRAALLEHPWILQVPITEPPLSPHQIGWMERGLDAMADTPLSEQEKLSSMLLADVYVRGQTQLHLQMVGAYRSAGVSSAEADLRYVRRLAGLVDAEAYPRICTALGTDALANSGEPGVQDEFEFGLARVLDGIDALVTARAGAGSV